MLVNDRSQKIVLFSTKKDQHFFIVTNWFLDHFQPFLV